MKYNFKTGKDGAAIAACNGVFSSFVSSPPCVPVWRAFFSSVLTAVAVRFPIVAFGQLPP